MHSLRIIKQKLETYQPTELTAWQGIWLVAQVIIIIVCLGFTGACNIFA